MIGLIACEESQEVTKAFRARGLDFFSNDLKECSGGYPEWHLQDDCFHVINRKFITIGFLGAHPVCQYLANSGVRWLASIKPKAGYEWSEQYQIYINPERFRKMQEAALFFKCMLNNIKSIGCGYVENPIMHKYALEIIGEKPTQIVQPWQFGHGETKATCLWLVGLPKLEPSEIVEGREQKMWKLPPSEERATLRSKTYPGIAKAMAAQWSQIVYQILSKAA